MQDINATITHNFQENIQYIEKEHPLLFEKLSAFDNAVMNGHYSEKYELIYDNENFDVVEHTTNKYLYNKSATKHTRLAVDHVDTSLDNDLFEGFVRTNYTQEEIKVYSEKKDLTSHHNFVAQLINLTQKTNTHELAIGKFIFFGTGLGLHLDGIISKILPQMTLIVEDDLELFRLSLFCTNYAKLAKKSQLFFSVFESEEEFSRTTEEFLNQNFYLNHYIKYFQLLSHSEEKNNLFYLSLIKQPHLRFLFHDQALTYIRPLEVFQKHYNILQKGVDLSHVATKPFILLGSGPSLQHNIEWLQKNKDYFTIVSVSSALKFLQNHDINADIITHLDPFNPSLDTFAKIEDLASLQNSLRFFSATSPQGVLEIFDKEKTYITEVGSAYEHNSLKVSAPCVGSWSLLTLLAIKAKEIYLLGLDLALDNITGKNHIDDHHEDKIIKTKEDALQNGKLSYKNSSITVAGNFRKKVYTTPHFYGSIEIINQYFNTIKQPYQHVYNLSDGAQLTIAEPLHPTEVQLMKNRSTETEKIHENLQNHIASHLTHEDISSLQRRITDAVQLKTYLEHYTLPQPFNADVYIKDLIHNCTTQYECTSVELSRTLEDYMKFISHYVYTFLQTSNEQETQQIDTIFRANIIKLIDIFLHAFTTTLQQEG